MDENILLNLRKFLVPEIVYGEDARLLSGTHAGNFGASRVLIVTDEGVQASGCTSGVEKSLEEAGIDYVVFKDLTPNPKDYEVMAGVEIFREENCDMIIAVGGGSPMDCAKGIGVVIGNGGNILDYEGVNMIPRPGPPLIFIPTTSGSSADVSQFAIITDSTRRVKIAIVSKMVIPEISLVDPKTTWTMDRELTAATGMDTLCHAFEAYVSTASSPLTDMAALAAVGFVHRYLKRAYENGGDVEARDKMMTASLVAGLAFSNASLGLVHAMAHSLGGGHDLAHGECNAILLEKVVEFNYADEPQRYDRLGQAMGVEIDRIDRRDRAAAVSGAVSGLRRSLGITQRLKDLGVTRPDLFRLAGFASKDACLATNPRDASIKEIEGIYEQIYD